MLPLSAVIVAVNHLLDVTVVAKYLAHVNGLGVRKVCQQHLVPHPWKRPGPGWTGQVTWSWLAEGVPARGRGLELGDELKAFPAPTAL